jgi:hypothetical protein
MKPDSYDEFHRDLATADGMREHEPEPTLDPVPSPEEVPQP